MADQRRAAHARAHAERDPRRQDKGGAGFLPLACGLIASFLLIAGVGCAPSERTARSAPETGASAPAVVVRAREGKAAFDPAQHRADDVREGAEQILREIPPPSRSPTVSETPPAPADTTWITVDGYRVQIFLSTTRERAEQAAERARRRFPSDSVYVVFQSPYHKVRVGDYRTYQEVTAKVEQAKNKGYRDAFPVPSPVRVIRRPGDKVRTEGGAQ